MRKDKGVVHVVGTGTIGEPLIGLLCSFKDQAGFPSYLPQAYPLPEFAQAQGVDCQRSQTLRG
jgi:hypothetical protein